MLAIHLQLDLLNYLSQQYQQREPLRWEHYPHQEYLPEVISKQYLTVLAQVIGELSNCC
jgi:hypothetical protein